MLEQIANLCMESRDARTNRKLCLYGIARCSNKSQTLSLWNREMLEQIANFVSLES
jgi:hypothetical protein